MASRPTRLQPPSGAADYRWRPASNEGLIVGRPVRNAVLRLIRGMDLRLHSCSVAPAESHEKCGPNRPTRAGSSCNNAGRRRQGTIVRAGWRTRSSATSPSSEMVFAPEPSRAGE